MQTNLRIFGVAIVASLLWTSPTSAATQGQGAKTQNRAKSSKIHYVGTASWYGAQHQGRKMANGKPFDSRKLTAASWFFPLGTSVRVVNVSNGESVIVTITDRGPNHRLNRLIDLSEAAAGRLDYVGQGLAQVFLYPVSNFETQSAQFDSTLVEKSAEISHAELQALAMSTPN
jgi:rare lipoprotein A